MSTITLRDLSDFLAAHGFANNIEGDAGIPVSSVNTLEDARDGQVSFLSNPKYATMLGSTRASVVIVARDARVPDAMTVIRCDDPYGAVTAAIVRLHGHRKHPQWNIHERAEVSPTASIGENPSIGPFVTIRENTTIGDDCTIYPGCYIAENVTIGSGVTLFPNVVIYDGSLIGSRVTIHANTVIGQDGLGYAPVNGQWFKIPQVGRIRIEDDVEIGACCAMDRATLGETSVGSGTKFSNSVVVGHGAKIGRDCMIVAQVGVAGSARVGNHVTLAGQVGVRGHLTIGDDAQIAAQSGVGGDIEPGAQVMGSPAVDKSAFLRQNALVRRLPRLKQRLIDMEREVQALRESLEEHVQRNG